MKITKEQSFEENRKFLGFIKESGTRMMHLEALMENIRGML